MTTKPRKTPAKAVKAAPKADILVLREQWLQKAVAAFRKHFHAFGVIVPADVKVSCGWPGGGSARKRIGECWNRASSVARVNEVFISPLLSDSTLTADVLGHELLHAVDDCKSKHGAAFTRNSKAVGYTGGKNSAAGPEALKFIADMIKAIGVYPHGKVSLPPKRTGSQHGLHKFECECGNIVYATQKKTEEFGEPICWNCGESMGGVDRKKQKNVTTV